MKSYVVRIYRYEKNYPEEIAGTIEDVEAATRTGFNSFDKLKDALTRNFAHCKNNKQGGKMKKVNLALVLLSLALLSACGGGGGGGVSSNPSTMTYTVGGTVSGLGSGKSVVLQNNGGDDLTVSANGSFTFSTAVAAGAGYAVTVLIQPSGQTCTASSNTGIASGADITSVSVVCSAHTYTVGGTVSGLGSGKSFVLQNNGGDDLTVSSNSSFTFSTAVADGAGYAVTVKTQPTGQYCEISGGNGTMSGANVTGVSLSCHNSGSLVASFGTAGIVMTDVVAGFNEQITAVAYQADGKIVAVGVVDSGLIAAVRYNSDGSLDTSFDSDGIVTTSIGTDSSGLAVAIQPDGKFVVAGYASSAGNADFAAVRYNPDGSLDTSFDGDGIVTTAIGSGTDEALSIALQSDGKIVLAGDSYNGTNYDIAIVRYNSNGSLDTSFDTDGKLTTAIGTGNDVAYSVAVQLDGKIVVAGYTKNGSQDLFALVRYNINGSPDTSFDSDGIVTTAIGFTQDQATSIAIQSDGKIVAAGSSYNDTRTYYDFAVARYNTNGSLDASFNGDGKVSMNIGNLNDFANALVIQPDGKIVVGGESNNSSTRDFALTRLNTDGSLDTTFDGDGKVTTDIYGHDVIYALAIGSGGKIAAAGNNGSSSFTMAEYWQ